jgi:hypothetical protein
MRDREFSPGFRLSKIDVLFLCVAIPASLALALTHEWLGGVIAFVVGHFFLFCNVFRISRGLELTWTGVFLGLAACSILVSKPPWLVTCLLSLVVTLIVVAIEMRRPSYHGAWWHRINPKLQDWWKMQAND